MILGDLFGSFLGLLNRFFKVILGAILGPIFGVEF